MPDGRLKVLVQGLTRARVDEYIQTDPFQVAKITILGERETKEVTLEQEAMARG